MANSIRVRILNREYSLIVDKEDEERTRKMAAYVDAKMKEFRRAHPEQPEVTAAVITALAVAEDLFDERQERGELERFIGEQFGEMATTLSEALAVNGKGN